MGKSIIRSEFYGTPANNQYFLVGNFPLLGDTTEMHNSIPWRYAGTFSKLVLEVCTNTRDGNSTFRLTKYPNTGMNLTVTITASTTGTFSDLTSSDTIGASDRFSYKIVFGGSSGAFVFDQAEVQFDYGSGNISLLGTFQQGTTYATDSSTWYIIFGCYSCSAAPTLSESYSQVKLRISGTLSYAFVTIQTNARTTNSYFVLRKNGADGNSSVNITALTTGVFVDSSGSDTIAVDDLVCYRVTTGTGSGESLRIRASGVHFVTTTGKSMWTNTYIYWSTLLPAPFLAGTTYDRYVCGELTATTGEEWALYLPEKYAITISKLLVRVYSNGVSNPTTIYLRKDHVNANNNVSISGGSTGYFEDASSSDSIAVDNYLSTRIVVGSGGTDIKFLYINYMVDTGDGITMDMSQRWVHGVG